MTENKNKDQAEKDRASRETQAPDIAEVRTELVGGIAVNVPQEPLEGPMREAAAGLIKNARRSESAMDPTPSGPSDEEIEEEAKRVEQRLKDSKPAPSDPLATLSRALAEHEVGEPILVSDQNPPAPGETERGWSPEVTARHPKVLLYNMEQIQKEEAAATPRAGRARATGIDPLDAEALATAQRELAFADVRQTMLINKAIRRGADQLAAAQEAANHGGPASAVAAEDAIASIKETARNAGHTFE